MSSVEAKGSCLDLAGAWEKVRGRHSPKQAPCVCHDQLDSMAMTELTHLQLVLQGSVGEDHHLYREGGSHTSLGSGVQES